MLQHSRDKPLQWMHLEQQVQGLMQLVLQLQGLLLVSLPLQMKVPLQVRI